MYEEEKILGNTFIINIKVGLKDIGNNSSLANSIDYVLLLDIVKQEMKKPTPLLEEVINRIELSVKKNFSKINYLFVAIKKKNPPLGVLVESSEVIVEKTY
jgi:dihydroneopterin aldolase